jgi:hypothetical protein
LTDHSCSCLRNVVALFHVIEKELEWRRARGQLEGFGAMRSSKPLVAIGADHPLEDELLMADYFRKLLFFKDFSLTELIILKMESMAWLVFMNP